ncbi:serine/threonine-protein kinase [Hyalangium gracile]|uniref:serine/threonine-protein kinase n=1 Tax=Hyalangium gracile TaxID=394092 RepID=UPI001CCB20EB|nr:serine/threonine-protein kinase [Hyalangium gracile]
MSSTAPEPAFVPPGEVLGSWRVTGWGGNGVHGAVYRGERADGAPEPAGPVAIKVALLPRDPEFAREVEVLSALRHPSIPRLWDSGEWQHYLGTRHPYIVMEWVEGTPLYAWAWRNCISSQQVLQLLAQLASALAAIHARGAVHRDLKGGNILVRHSDSRAILIDFGSCLPPEAAHLTQPGEIPGTPAYHPPEVALFPLRTQGDAKARYVAGPADDIYALGVTAYRLVTGRYPEAGERFRDKAGTWQARELWSPSPDFINHRVEPRLNALILRMLSARPEERGTAAELAEALEQAARQPLPESTQPLFEPQPPAEPGRPHGPVRLWRPLLAMAAAILALVAETWWTSPRHGVEKPALARHDATGAGDQNGGAARLGDTAQPVATESSSAPTAREAMTGESFLLPRPDQAQPDTRGQCPRKRQVAINGRCWGILKLAREECEDLSGQLLNDTCYVPVLPPGRRAPTSHPPPKP